MTEIRRVFPADNGDALHVLTQLHLECFRPSELHPDMFSRGQWWIALDGGQPVGFAGMTPSVRWCDAVYLCRSGVVESARGSGLQKRLIKARLATAKKLDYRHIVTDTRRNPASANSLIACGFRMYQPAAPWSFRDALYWKKDLLK